ncbi:MAG TPA: glycosyltransferase, partial [Acidobacteriota bacterium]|nr:glycosyltransferase [Acidobacteriota bacterium]
KLEALRDANLTVYPSVHEVFGLVALESLLCGTPVIVGDDDGAAEIIRKTGGADVVSWGNIDQLVHAITKHLDQPKNVEELCRARDFIINHYNWRSVASQTANFYQDSLKS